MHRSLLITAALVMGLPMSLFAQTTPSESKIPVIKASARTVVVDVVVTKGNGDPVQVLSQSDFSLEENGKPQTINFFEEHTGKTLPAGEPKPPAPLPPNVYSNIPPAPESDSVNVLLIDMLNIEVTDQPFVRSQYSNF